MQLDRNYYFIYHQYMTDQNQTSTSIPADQYEKNKMIDQVALVSFVDDLIRERKDANITDANVQEVRATLLKKVNEEINTHMINCLSDAERVALDAMLDKNATDKELHEYFVSKIPNLSIEIASVMLRFRAAYLYPVTSGEDATASSLSSISEGTAETVQNAPSSVALNQTAQEVNPLEDMRPAPIKPVSDAADVLPPAPVRRMN